NAPPVLRARQERARLRRTHLAPRQFIQSLGRRRATEEEQASALSAEGEEHHISAHGRRSLANGPLRLQAGDEGGVRQGPSRIHSQWPAAYHHDLGAEALSDCALEL